VPPRAVGVWLSITSLARDEGTPVAIRHAVMACADALGAEAALLLAPDNRPHEPVFAPASAELIGTSFSERRRLPHDDRGDVPRPGRRHRRAQHPAARRLRPALRGPAGRPWARRNPTLPAAREISPMCARQAGPPPGTLRSPGHGAPAPGARGDDPSRGRGKRGGSPGCRGSVARTSGSLISALLCGRCGLPLPMLVTSRRGLERSRTSFSTTFGPVLASPDLSSPALPCPRQPCRRPTATGPRPATAGCCRASWAAGSGAWSAGIAAPG
jgi:hypothetical protein